MNSKATSDNFFKARWLVSLTILISLFSLHTTAQNKSHNQVWTDVSGKLQLTRQLSLTPELGYRSEPSINLNQVYLRTYLSYRPNEKLKLSLWAAHFSTWQAENFRTIEVRTSQFVSLYWPQIGGFKFEHRFGLDQRMFYLPGYEMRKYVHRSRFKIGLHTPVFAMLGSEKRFYAKASFEVLRNMNLAETALLVDHDWVSIVFGAKLTKGIKLESNVLLINGLDPETLDFEREISVFRLRLKCNLQ